MSEIEKMHELAGVNKKCIDKRYEKCTGVCYDCKYFIYPPFTAEKQLNVLKIIVYNHGFNSLDKPIWDKGWDIAIAKLVNIYWEVMFEEERKQIRDILKG